TFFMRRQPTPSIAKPACMNITRQAATITQTVSAAMPAAWLAVVSSASTAMGSSPAANAAAAAIATTRRRRCNAFQKSLGTGNDFHLRSSTRGKRVALAVAAEPRSAAGSAKAYELDESDP